ncbi:MAG: DHH family phosphoesterase, partial [Halobacteria archaeon]|nr:DHH family phosphoesterase [Halobacteria archaeon]
MSSGETTSRAEQLVEVLGRGDSLAIVSHDNPDPDCIASALALRAIAHESGVPDVEIFYSGEVSHQQNRAFVNLLNVDMHDFSHEAIAEYDMVGFVDHSARGENNEVAEGRHVDIIIDHHPPDEKVEANFVDVREDFGATTTILVEYLRELDMDIDEDLATALLFAIRTETLDFLRGTTSREYEAAEFLHGIADIELLKQMIKPAFSPQT